MSTLNKRERAGAGWPPGRYCWSAGPWPPPAFSVATRSSAARQSATWRPALPLAAWARLQRKPLPRPAGREWAWLAALAAIGLAGCSVLMIQATRAADPASVGVIIGAAPLVIIVAAAITAGHRPTRRVLLAAAVVTAGSAAAQLGGGTGPTWSPAGLLWSAGALGGVVGSSLLAAPLLPRLGALAVTVYACGLAGIPAASHRCRDLFAGGPPILRTPNATQLAALAYLTIAITALVFVAWYGAMERLGVDRTGLFNGLIPVTSLAAVALTGTGRCHGRPQGDRARRADGPTSRRVGYGPRAGRESFTTRSTDCRRSFRLPIVLCYFEGLTLVESVTASFVPGWDGAQPLGPGAGKTPPTPDTSRAWPYPPPRGRPS